MCIHYYTQEQIFHSTENKQAKNDPAWKKSDDLYSYRYRQLQAVFSLEKYEKENKQTDINFVFSFLCAVNQKKGPILSLQKKPLCWKSHCRIER